MNIEGFLFGCSMGGMLIGLILYVVFGQLTVKKLRRNPNTKNVLGVEFASGWDIYNVAQALSLPKLLLRRLENSPLSALYANSKCLRKNTNVFDKVLAFIFYWLFTVSGLTLIIVIALNGLGVF
ncbi:hypothetical protein [uncultured Desulfobacter sp.]|uniref:hypothetical protein n=1 Tax=uncultured Desulfobacter sp. TaxID=240139 RepID=UPI0029F4D2DD|nr:hypothetical protein [uncultured Desulfobacter sp.]